MKNMPTLVTLSSLRDPSHPLAEVKPGCWLPARCYPYWSWRLRLHYAWMVFTGQLDVFKWDYDRCVKPVPPDLDKCPGCGGPADNGFDRCVPPSPYFCNECMEQHGAAGEQQG